jgi:hypothetical protein
MADEKVIMEEKGEDDVMLPKPEMGVFILEANEGETCKDKSDHPTRYLVTALICVSFLCLVSIFIIPAGFRRYKCYSVYELFYTKVFLGNCVFFFYTLTCLSLRILLNVNLLKSVWNFYYDETGLNYLICGMQ